jgi:hypothetical protein
MLSLRVETFVNTLRISTYINVAFVVCRLWILTERFKLTDVLYEVKKKGKAIPVKQAVEPNRVVRRRGSHIF